MMLQLLCSAKWISPFNTFKSLPAMNKTFRLMSDKCKKGGKYRNLIEISIRISY